MDRDSPAPALASPAASPAAMGCDSLAPALAPLASGTCDSAASALVPLAVAAPLARATVGCSTQRLGVAGIEFARSNRSRCQVCSQTLNREEPRFIVRLQRNRPAAFVHLECVIGLPFPADDIAGDLEELEVSHPALREAVFRARAVLEAC